MRARQEVDRGLVTASFAIAAEQGEVLVHIAGFGVCEANRSADLAAGEGVELVAACARARGGAARERGRRRWLVRLVPRQSVGHKVPRLFPRERGPAAIQEADALQPWIQRRSGCTLLSHYLQARQLRAQHSRSLVEVVYVDLLHHGVAEAREPRQHNCRSISAY